MIEIVKATAEHAKAIVPLLRAQERFSADVVGLSPEVVLNYGIETSLFSLAGLVNGKVACIWGLDRKNVLDQTHLWLVTTSLVEENKIRFLRENKRFLAWAVKEFGTIYGYVDIRFKVSVCWMEWLGFVRTTTENVNGHLAHRFELRA